MACELMDVPVRALDLEDSLNASASIQTSLHQPAVACTMPFARRSTGRRQTGRTRRDRKLTSRGAQLHSAKRPPSVAVRPSGHTFRRGRQCAIRRLMSRVSVLMALRG